MGHTRVATNVRAADGNRVIGTKLAQGPAYEAALKLSGMHTATQNSVGAIKAIGGTVNRVAEIAASIAGAVEEQGAATAEIAHNVQQASHGTTLVASNITEVNRGASETGAASAQVLSSAKSLASGSNRLTLELAKFLSTVRAA